MNWYLQSGKEADVVLSTRIRYARNLQEFRFNMKRKEEIEAFLEKVKEETPEIGYGLKFLKLKDMDKATLISLVEKNLISPEFALNKQKNGAILLNDEENICIMINEEDHIRLQVFNCGLDLEGTYNLAKELDKKIENIFNIAKSKKYGYLTSCPTNVGTGIRASVMVHLPGLTKTGNIRKILESINSFGMNIRGVYGEKSEVSGDMYQISNKVTLGISEEKIVKNLRAITEKIIEQERLARKYLGNNQIELEDKVYRSFGILTNSRKISSEETRKLLSDVKLGTDMGIITELTDSKISKLYLYTKPANLEKYVGEELDSYDRDIKRAEVIKRIINEN
ncbi:MAG: protein arginine kinase [Clostridia bacterium]|nr:protein arginine kinase [Clostridia bacterium]